MRKWLVIGVIVVVAVVVVGVAVQLVQRPSQAEQRTFDIGLNEWVGFAPFFLAKERGYYGDLAVSLHFIDLEGDKRAGLYAGRLDMICETMDMFQTNREKADYPGKIVFAVDQSLGGDGVVAVEDVKSIKDLKGRTVVSEPGLPAHFVLQYLLHNEGMTFADVKLQDMTSADAAAAFIAGRADVAGTYEPYLTKALSKREGAHLLASTKDLAGLIVDVAIVTDKTLSERRADVEAIYRGWCRAMDDLQRDPKPAVAIMARAFKLDATEFDETRSGLEYIDQAGNLRLFGPEVGKPAPIFKTFEEIGDILIENGLTKMTTKAQDKIDTSIVASTPR